MKHCRVLALLKREKKTQKKQTNKQNFMSLRLFSKQEKVLSDIIE